MDKEINETSKGDNGMKASIFYGALLVVLSLTSCIIPANFSNDITETGTVRSVGNVSVNEYVLTTTDGIQYAISETYAKYTGCVLCVTGCVDGDTMYGEFLDIHYVDVLDN